MAKKKIRASKEKTYSMYLETSHINLSPVIWIAVAIAISAIMGFLTFIIFADSPGIPIMTIIILPILIIGFPIIIKERRDLRMEEAIPDVFEELATSLRAGATIEQALLDLTKIQKGPLIDELSIALNDMEGGFSFEESLENLIERIDVVMIKRIFTIVIDGRKAGGELADILDAVASDARQMARLMRERRSKTVLYVIFIFMAGALVAPLIFGFVTQIAGLVANVGSETAVANPLNIPGTNINIFWIYLLIETFISGIMLAVVRGIKLWKGLVFYSLTMALVGTIVFEASKWFASLMLPASL
jgi:flagellar protein FlaJ